MAKLTPLDGKLGEVLGLAQLRRKRRPMSPGWKPPNNPRSTRLIDWLEGRRTAIRELAQETKMEAEEMLQTYLEGFRVPDDGGGRRARPLGDRADDE